MYLIEAVLPEATLPDAFNKNVALCVEPGVGVEKETVGEPFLTSTDCVTV